MKLEEHICIKSLYQQPLSHKFSQMDNGEMLRRFNNELNDPTEKKKNSDYATDYYHGCLRTLNQLNNQFYVYFTFTLYKWNLSGSKIGLHLLLLFSFVLLNK